MTLTHEEVGKGEGGYVIREVRLDDIDRVIYINRVTLPENYSKWFFMEHLEKWRDIFLVAEFKGEVVAYIMTRVEWGIGFFTLRIIKKGHIVSIAVLPEYRRRGIATKLMVNVMKTLKEHYKCSEVYLEVRVSNTPAISLYEKLGFEKVKIIKGYYLDGEDAYIMARKL